MGATQRYKQAQQQTRVITNENGYLKGMYYTDVPLPEGYVKTLVNLDIDSVSGKLTPRPGLQSIGKVAFDPKGAVPNAVKGHNPLIMYDKYYTVLGQSKLCGRDASKQVVQSALYHYCARDEIKYTGTHVIFYRPDLQGDYYSLFIGQNRQELFTRVPIKQIHNRVCRYNDLFKKPLGAFLNDQYFQFRNATTDQPGRLVYTKRGEDILNSSLDEQVYHADRADIVSDQYYLCYTPPTQLNPSLAATQGFNMLLDDPYKFECTHTAVNAITLQGLLPYDKVTGQLALNPRPNDVLQLKAYYIAPTKYVSTEIQPKYYATTSAKIEYTVDGETVEQDPITVEDLSNYVTAKLNDYAVGTWWHIADTTQYYMVLQKYNTQTKELVKSLEYFRNTKPNYSEKLSVLIAEEDATETKVRVEWQTRQSTASDWNTVQTEDIKLSEQNLEPFTCEFTMSDKEMMVRVRVLDITPEGTDLDIVLATQTIGISTSENNSNAFAKKYDLSACMGMCEWEQRLVLWGVPDALNTVFVSDINNPNYFPYPNNIDTFPDPVMGVYNYGDELIVLTTNSLYRLTWSTEGAGWTHTLVQRNLHITEADLSMNCVIKNMFLFKSGNQYYMMVPKSASVVKGETTIAPISKTIEPLLENFHEEIYRIVKLMRNEPDLSDFTQNLVYYHSFVDGNVVALNYVYDISATEDWIEIQKETSTFFYVQLRYDTDTRTWSLRMFSTPYILQVPYTDAMGQGRYVLPTQGNDGEAFLQYCEFKDDADELVQYYTTDGEEVHDPFIRNYQYIDTGNREIDTEHKKRFREFQFKIKNINTTALAFYTGFYVDGAERKNIVRYETSVNEDNEIIVTPVLDDTVSYTADGLFMPTELGTEDSKVCWVVGSSAFPGRTLWKVRMPVSGKGYTPRVELLSLNEQRYEILGHSWVYRTMDAR